MMITTAQIKHVLENYNIKINGALHIGAHDCEEIPFYDSIGLSPEQVIWIDALQQKVDECKSRNIPNVYQAVVSDKGNEIVTFNETNNGHSSSLLDLGTHFREHPHIYVSKTHTVKTTTIDDFMEMNKFDPPTYNFWNLDIQGAEYKALLGGMNALLSTEVLYLEINKDCLRLPELDSFLNLRGFVRVLTNMTPHHWGDAMYIHKKFMNELPVVSVNIMGGLGNQLFQIASAYAYARREHCSLQVLKIMSNGNRGVYWDTLLKKSQPFLVDELRLNLLRWNEPGATEYGHIPSIPSSHQGIYLSGYLQSSRYFYNDTIKQEIKHLFRPEPELLREVRGKYGILVNNRNNVIVIHARRTDYIAKKDYHGPLEIDYYRLAVVRMLEKCCNPIFVFASDDLSFWNELAVSIPQLSQHPSFIIEDTDINTFVLLQQFKYYIMSNSTFCWWAVWLSDSKHVIVPSKWFGPKGPQKYEDIYEPEWEKI